MIRHTTLIEIKKSLDKSTNFSSTDFILKSGYNSLNIIYEYDNTFSFQIDIPTEISKLTKTEKETSSFGMVTKHKEYEYEAYEFSGIMKPGKVSSEEKVTFEGQTRLFKFIEIWLENLWTEITIQPEYRKIEKIEEELNNIKSKFDNLSDEFFTKEEAELLIERLNTLESNFKEKLEIEIQDKEILLTTLEELHVELEKLKGQATLLNKKNWFKSFSVKIFSWITKDENRKF